MKWNKKYSITISFGIILFVSVFTSMNVKWGDLRWHGIMGHDANGYYAYLPAVFIYDDLNFLFYDHELKELKKENVNLNFDYRENYNNNKVNKYFIGTSIAQFPFFITAHVLSTPLGFESSGYSKIYYVFIALAAIFYMLLGLLFFNKVLILYDIDVLNRAISLLALLFGTHLFYYTIFEPGMSHVYSFAFITMMVYYGKKYFILPNTKTAIIYSLLLGLITLIRPVNLLVILLLPFIAGSFESLKNGLIYLFKTQGKTILFSSIVFLLVLSIQLIIYKLQTGSFLVYSYTEEGFNFLDPHMIAILFSYKKGLFLYTPLCLLAFIGMIKLYHRSRFETSVFIAFFLILTYILSSWWIWWYGGSFSSRVYVDFLSLFGILLALSLVYFKGKKTYRLYLLLIVFFILFNQKQTYLYRVAYIHWEDMNKEKYWQSTYHPFQLWYTRLMEEDSASIQPE